MFRERMATLEAEFKELLNQKCSTQNDLLVAKTVKDEIDGKLQRIKTEKEALIKQTAETLDADMEFML